LPLSVPHELEPTGKAFDYETALRRAISLLNNGLMWLVVMDVKRRLAEERFLLRAESFVSL
jgi:hypothetical protein